MSGEHGTALSVGQTVTVPGSGRFDPSHDLKRSDIYLWPDFEEQILPAVSPMEAVPEATLAVFDLVAEQAGDTEIRDELPTGHVFEDAGEFSAILVAMLTKQEEGVEGDLLTNGYANIFYVHGIAGEVFVVAAYWITVYRRWHVHADSLGNHRWAAGYRVFSRNCLPAEASAQAG